jgi:hydrogenase/urease accessory protein HupE
MKRLLLLLLLFIAAPVVADEFRPAYLQLTQTGPATYDVLWRLPALNAETVMKVEPVFPAGTKATMPHSRYSNGMAVLRWAIDVPGGLDGKAIGFAGLPQARIDVLARMARADGTVQLERILAVDPQFSVKPSPGAFEVVRTYTVLGIEHILTGFDHLLFVLALVIIVRGTKRLLWTVTAFTVAHSITLALATLGVIHVPGPPVEAMIALSIVFVASEIVQQQSGREGLASTQPWLVAFTFGLLHGLGFAGALAEVGLPENSIPLALLFFNVGVEIGQLLFIVGVLAAIRLLRRPAGGRLDLRQETIVTAYAVGTIASYWTIERIFSFWS